MRPSLGRIVLYVLPGGVNVGKVRPAMIVHVETDVVVHLRVFLDWEDDPKVFTSGDTTLGHLPIARSVGFSGEKKPGTWHWPERVS